MTFIDTGSRYAMVHFLKNRRNIPTLIESTLQLIAKQTGSYPQIFRTDNAKEYKSASAQQVYQKNFLHFTTTTPYSPQENSIAERLNQTLVNAAKAALFHSKLPPHYWEDAICDALYKYNITIHRSTGQLPYSLWFDCPPSPSELYAFGQLGSVPSLKPKRKLETRSIPARYMYAKDDNYITILRIADNTYHQVRAIDFMPYTRSADPVAQTSYAFKARTIHPTPRTITKHTPAPLCHRQATRYPDAPMWAVAHDKELDTIDITKTIHWIKDDNTPPNIRPIPLSMGYRYKLNANGTIATRKARCAVRRDLMRPYEHYDPKKTAHYMADRTTVRTLFAYAAAHALPIQHTDISSAYLSEPYTHTKPVYVKQFPKFDSTLSHPGHPYGILKKTLYGTRSGGYLYIDGLFKFLRSHQDNQSDHDPCLFYKNIKEKIILTAISTDEFLVVAISTDLVDDFYSTLSQKYKVKRLGFPTNYLGSNVTRTPNGGIHIPAALY